jgi:hypothetical protein
MAGDSTLVLPSAVPSQGGTDVPNRLAWASVNASGTTRSSLLHLFVNFLLVLFFVLFLHGRAGGCR